jgi:general secretion pathway protein J
MKRRGEAGVTLIELLIAVTLVSLLSVGMVIALRFGLSTMERTTNRLYDNRKLVSVNRIIDSQIAGIFAARTTCLGTGRPAGEITFFQGEPQTMRLLSTYSLQEGYRGYPRVLEYQVIPGENAEGVRLIVNELLYTGPLMTGLMCMGEVPRPEALGLPAPLFTPVRVGQQSFVLADRLAFARFFYRESLPQPPYERWTPLWTSRLLPSGIRLELQPLESERQRLPLVTITAPIRITRDPTLRYTDTN